MQISVKNSMKCESMSFLPWHITQQNPGQVNLGNKRICPNNFGQIWKYIICTVSARKGQDSSYPCAQNKFTSF